MQRVEHGGQRLGRVRAVCIHLDDALVARRTGPLEAGDVCAAEAILARAVQHVHAGICAGHPVCDGAGAVRAAVVHHEQVDVGDG